MLIARTAWQRSRAHGARPFAAMVAAAGVWSFFMSLEYMTQDRSWRILWSKMEYLGITSLPHLWLFFSLDYSQRGMQQLKRLMRTPLPYIFPAIMLGLVFSNESHGLVWRNVEQVISDAGTTSFYFQHGIAFYIFIIYAYSLLLAGSLALIREAARFPKLYKRQGRSLLLATAIPWVANLIYISGFSPWQTIDLTPIAFVLSGAILGIGVFRLYLFDIVPVAHDSVIESLPEGVIVIDTNHRVAYSNTSARRLLQSNADSVAADSPDPWVGQKAAALLKPFPALQRVLENTANTSTEINFPGETPRTIEAAATFVYAPTGDINGRLLTLRDITESKRIDEELRLQSAALQSTTNAIVITNKQGEIQFVNPAFSQITGYDQEEALGRKLNILNSGRQDKAFYKELWTAISTDTPWHGELVNRRKDGSYYTEEQTIAPVHNDSGAVTHYIAVKQDITQRKLLEEMRDDLMKALVHDLRNPLSSILLSLEAYQMLPENSVVSPSVHKMLVLARDATWRMMGMINAIMDMSRIESGQLVLDRQAVAMAEMVEQAINQQSSLATHNDILLLNAVSYDLPLAYIDSTLIIRVLQNLLDNAIKFTPNGGTVEIHAQPAQEESFIELRVTDSGPGIPADLLRRVFDKYATGPNVRRGAGLGLAFCRLAVNAHGGRIWVDNSSQPGTAFCFTLPISTALSSPNEDIPLS